VKSLLKSFLHFSSTLFLSMLLIWSPATVLAATANQNSAQDDNSVVDHGTEGNPTGRHNARRDDRDNDRRDNMRGEDDDADVVHNGNLAPLSKQDRRILKRGEIVQGRYIGGGITGSIVGFGIGHAIQGRYPERGWIFTVGEGVGITMFYVGILACFGDAINGQSCTPPVALIGGGLIAFVGFHIWEVIDLWVVPPQANRRYRELRRMGYRPPISDFQVYPTIMHGEAPGLGVAFRF
jgi:hypothetical protein